MSPLLSSYYRDLLIRQHKEMTWGGDKTFRHMNELLPLLCAHPRTLRTILDYGAGRESLANHIAGSGMPYEVTSYDPGTGKEQLPERADVVVCCDVLEHIEPLYLMPNLDRIFDIAREAIYLVIAVRQAKQPMVDGSDAHLIVKAPRIWLSFLNSFADWRIDWCTYKEGKELRCWIIRDD